MFTRQPVVIQLPMETTDGCKKSSGFALCTVNCVLELVILVATHIIIQKHPLKPAHPNADRQVYWVKRGYISTEQST